MLWLVLLTLLVLPHDHHDTNARGAAVMGFDQERTVHHFYLYPDGGAIDVAVKDHRDSPNRDAIRSHLPHIATMFGSGDFNAPMLVHDSPHVPGTAVLIERKDAVRYVYADRPDGGRVTIA